MSQPTLSEVGASTWRVLVADDHELYRNGLTELIRSDPELEICAEAENLSDALEQFRAHKPNLVIVDISLAKGNGLDLVERIKTTDPATVVLVISMFDERVYADRAIAAGASGYVCKQAPNSEILAALHTVKRHGIYVSQLVMDRLLSRKKGPIAPGTSLEEERLSKRELQIFTLIGQGETTQKISRQLYLSPSTVETYRERIKTKLNLANGSELTRRAILWMLRST